MTEVRERERVCVCCGAFVSVSWHFGRLGLRQWEDKTLFSVHLGSLHSWLKSQVDSDDTLDVFTHLE